jgi:hypothetical protein
MPLGGIETWFWGLAIFGSVIFIGKLILMLTMGGDDFGGDDGGDVGLDTGGDGGFGDDAGGHVDVDHGHAGDDGHHGHGTNWFFQILSVQTIAAFAMGAGWFGLGASRGDFGFESSAFMTLLICVVGGVFFAWIQLFILSKVRLLESRGSRLRIRDAIGKTGQVYLGIPAGRAGQGKVRIKLGASIQILPAVTDGAELKSFTSVHITSVDEGGVLVVEPANA